MAFTKVKINYAGGRQLLKSADLMQEVSRQARMVANQANAMVPIEAGEDKPFDWAPRMGETRVYAVAKTATYKGRYYNAKDETLIRALGRCMR